MRKTMDEIRGAIQGVNHPLVGRKLTLSRVTKDTGLFSHKSVVRIRGAKDLDNCTFGATIDFRDIIAGPFTSHL